VEQECGVPASRFETLGCSAEQRESPARTKQLGVMYIPRMQLSTPKKGRPYPFLQSVSHAGRHPPSLTFAAMLATPRALPLARCRPPWPQRRARVSPCHCCMYVKEEKGWNEKDCVDRVSSVMADDVGALCS